jgi:hypothetical protein
VTTYHKRMINNTLRQLNAIITAGPDNEPVDLTGLTVKFYMEEEATGTPEIAETATGITIHPTQTFTGATTGLATCNGHGVKEGNQIVVANSGGALPTGLAASTRYFAVNVTPNAFGLASLPGGQTVITAAGTGTNTFYIVGSVQYQFLAANVDTELRYRAWFVASSGSASADAPVAKQGITVEITARGN